jgi:hypothetical protein
VGKREIGHDTYRIDSDDDAVGIVGLLDGARYTSDGPTGACTCNKDIHFAGRGVHECGRCQSHGIDYLWPCSLFVRERVVNLRTHFSNQSLRLVFFFGKRRQKGNE